MLQNQKKGGTKEMRNRKKTLITIMVLIVFYLIMPNKTQGAFASQWGYSKKRFNK